ncbi:MAG: hypothetical protein QG608_3119 [Actinomycetota bacterium]|nr:hypothetical protein [Actinomycetota bacterium]
MARRPAHHLSTRYDKHYYFRGEIEPLVRAAGLVLDRLDRDFHATPFGRADYPGELVFHLALALATTPATAT